MKRATYLITLTGPFPAKKNRLSPRRGGMMYDKTVKTQIDRMAMEARCQWLSKASLHSPDVEVRLWIANASKDRDGIWTSILDALKVARVIVDDSIRMFNGTEIHHPVVLVAPADERAEIRLTEH